MTADSDIDLFVVRPAGVEADDEAWRGHVEQLAVLVTRWTGNDTRMLEYGEQELVEESRRGDPVLTVIAHEGIPLAGPRSYLQQLAVEAVDDLP